MNPPQTILAIVLLMALASTAVAEEVVEVWKCFDYSDRKATKKTLFELRGSTTLALDVGTVHVAGVTSYTDFALVGLNRRWNWGLRSSRYRFSVVIKPGGQGEYFDFDDADEDGRAKPRQIFKCEVTTIVIDQGKIKEAGSK